MNINKINDTTYEAEITFTIAQRGHTPQEAFARLYESSDEVRMYIAQHPEIRDWMLEEYGPKTEEEAFALLKRITGQE